MVAADRPGPGQCQQPGASSGSPFRVQVPKLGSKQTAWNPIFFRLLQVLMYGVAPRCHEELAPGSCPGRNCISQPLAPTAGARGSVTAPGLWWERLCRPGSGAVCLLPSLPCLPVDDQVHRGRTLGPWMALQSGTVASQHHLNQASQPWS